MLWTGTYSVYVYTTCQNMSLPRATYNCPRFDMFLNKSSGNVVNRFPSSSLSNSTISQNFMCAHDHMCARVHACACEQTYCMFAAYVKFQHCVCTMNLFVVLMMRQLHYCMEYTMFQRMQTTYYIHPHTYCCIFGVHTENPLHNKYITRIYTHIFTYIQTHTQCWNSEDEGLDDRAYSIIERSCIIKKHLHWWGFWMTERE
jgi:hypothetical protein